MSFVLATPEAGDAATVTTNSAHANGPVTNLQKMQPTTPWLTASAAVTSAYVRFDQGSALPWRTVAMLHTNANSTARWRITADNSTGNLGTASAAVDTGWVTFWPSTDLSDWSHVNNVYTHSSQQTQRYVQVNFDTLTLQLSVGRGYLSDSFVSSRGVDFGFTYGWEDIGSKQGTAHGGTITKRSGVRPIANFSFSLRGPDAKSTYLDNFYKVMRTRGGTKDVLFVIDDTPGDHLHKNIYYGLLDMFNAVSLPTYQTFQQRFRLTGLI